jgi:hypothetical protein
MPVCLCTAHTMHRTGIPWLRLPFYNIVWAPSPWIGLTHRQIVYWAGRNALQTLNPRCLGRILDILPADACGSGSQTGHLLATLAPNLSIIDWLSQLFCYAKHHVRVWIVEPSTLTYANSYHSRMRPATDFVGKASCNSTDDMGGFAESTGRLLPFLCVVALVLRSFALS